MTCRSCGNIVDNKSNKCKSCGKILGEREKSKFSNLEEDRQRIINEENRYKESVLEIENIPNWLIAIVSLILPPIGVVMYMVFKKEYKKKSKICIACAITGVALIYILQVIGWAISFIDYQEMWSME